METYYREVTDQTGGCAMAYMNRDTFCVFGRTIQKMLQQLCCTILNQRGTGRKKREMPRDGVKK